MTDDTYSEAETVARREAALKRMLATPPIRNAEITERSTAAARQRGDKRAK